MPLIGIASSLIGTARRVRASQSWSEPMTLWTCVVAPSGDRKSPGLDVTVRALDRIEENTPDAISAACLAHETRRQNAREAAEEWKVQRKAALNAEPRGNRLQCREKLSILEILFIRGCTRPIRPLKVLRRCLWQGHAA